MRTPMAALAFTALALFTAAPTALAQGQSSDGAGDTSNRAQRLMKAADTFDAKAAGMHARATRLRATGLELRTEAQELAGSTTEPEAEGKDRNTTTTIIVNVGSGGTATPPATTTPPAEDEGSTDEGTKSDDCAWDGEDDLGFRRQHDEEPAKDASEDSNAAEICQLIKMADRLEQRADTLDAAAVRMEGHAAKLREKATKVLGKCESESLLRRAANMRAKAAALRTQADTLRDSAFDGPSIDDEAVAQVRKLELKAAAFETRANRFEARAAKAA